ncbi:hypothetical protein FACS1894166_01680 [Bacilli bacterium]|nr:hypothetical protein FACS1894166_01680 [Bacilli bacterium]
MQRSFSIDPSIGINKQGIINGTAFYPMFSDAVGESKDINFIKNRTMTRSQMDYVVGIPGLLASNP